MLNALVFDFDGIIADSEPLHYRAFLRVAERLGLRFDYAEYLEKYVGYDDRDAFRVMLGEVAQRNPQAQVPWIDTLVQQKAEAFEHEVEQGIGSYPGVRELIREVAAAGMPLAICSGATRRDIDAIVGKLELEDAFGVIVSADDVRRSKPDPEGYAKAVDLLAERHPGAGVVYATSLAIEDTETGLESAQRAGLMSLAVTNTRSAEILSAANRVVDTLAGVDLATLRAWYADTAAGA